MGDNASIAIFDVVGGSRTGAFFGNGVNVSGFGDNDVVAHRSGRQFADVVNFYGEFRAAGFVDFDFFDVEFHRIVAFGNGFASAISRSSSGISRFGSVFGEYGNAHQGSNGRNHQFFHGSTFWLWKGFSGAHGIKQAEKCNVEKVIL